MTTLNLQVAAGSGDAHELFAGMMFSHTESFLRMDSSSNVMANWLTGLYFSGVAIDKNETISTATLQLYVESTSFDDPNLDVWGELNPDPPDFATIGDVANRGKTVASTSVVEDGVGAGWYSIDVTAILQELVNQAGWENGNAVVLLCFGKSDTAKAFRCESYDGNASQAAKLDIEFGASAEGAVTSNTAVGVSIGL